MTSSAPYLPGFESEGRRRDLSQFFTPPWLAKRLWSWMLVPQCSPLRILEPAAGNGALIRPLSQLDVPVERLVAYEVDETHVRGLRELVEGHALNAEVRARDFLACGDVGMYDVAVMNSPYEQNQEVMFAERALRCCARVAGVFRAAMLFGQGRNEFWRWTDPVRVAYLSERPDFGGDYSPQADFVVMQIARRQHACKQGEPTTTNVEWWMREA